MKLSLKNLDVNLLHCNIFSSYSLPEPVRLQKRTVCNYELDFFIESDGGVEIDGVYVPFAKNEINFRKPGQIVQGLGRYHCYCIQLTISESMGSGPQAKPNESANSLQATREDSLNSLQPLYDMLHITPAKITGTQAEQIGLIIQKMYQHYLCDEYLLVKSELYKLVHELLSAQQNTFLSYNSYIKKAIEYMNLHYREEIHFEGLAHRIGISKPYFFDQFKQCTGTTPNQFLTRLRIEKAKYLLLSTDMQIKDIGFECGFDDNVYFSYLFRKETGIPASVFRDRERNSQLLY